MIYLQITSEMVHEETSNTVQKIILNFLQIVSLAGGLPLQWPASISVFWRSCLRKVTIQFLISATCCCTAKTILLL